MTSHKNQKTKPRVAEPVQVYLDPDDQDRLARLTDRLDTSKSEVLRRGLEALELQVSDPASHPALGLIGIGRSDELEAAGSDPAREHDEELALGEEAAWLEPGSGDRQPSGKRDPDGDRPRPAGGSEGGGHAY